MPPQVPPNIAAKIGNPGIEQSTLSMPGLKQPMS
jgi:hypothetical protein